MLLAITQPLFAADIDMDPLSGWQQLGVCGGCFVTMAIQSYNARRGMKDSAVEHKEGLNSLAGEIKGLRSDIVDNLERQLEERRNSNK